MSAQTSCCKTGFVESYPLGDLVEYVTPHAPQVPQGVAEQALRNALIEFARRSLILKRDIYVDLQECVEDYTIEVEDGYRIVAVNHVCVDKCTILRPADLRCHEAPRGHYVFRKPSDLLIGWQPPCDMPEGMVVEVTVAPGQNSCEVDACIFDGFAETIAEGAMSRLFLQKGTAWYDVSSAGIMLRRFKLGMNMAKTERLGTAPRFMKPKRFI